MLRILILYHILRIAFPDDKFLIGKFPGDFGWGACSSAYQTEGAWDVDGIFNVLHT